MAGRITILAHMEALNFTTHLSAAPEEAWDAWTTDSGIRGFLAPDCHIEIRPDGPYEIFFNPDAPPGERGAEGMRVLAVEKPGFLSFTWNAPPSIPTIREQRTWVEVRIAAADTGCRLTLTNGGYGDGEDWAAARAYFLRAWGDIVLPRLEQYLAGRPVAWD